MGAASKTAVGGGKEQLPRLELGNLLQEMPFLAYTDRSEGVETTMNDRLSRLETNAAVANEKFATISAEISASNNRMDAHMKVIEAKFETITKLNEGTQNTLSRMDQRITSIETTVNTMNGTMKAMPGWPGLMAASAVIVGLIGVFIALT